MQMRAFGSAARRRRLKSSRGTSTVPETKSAGVIRDSSNFVFYRQSLCKCCPASNIMHAVFCLYKSFPERDVELADTNCRGIQFGICCLLYEERTCLCVLLTALSEWRDSGAATNYGPHFIHLLLCSTVPQVTLHIFYPLKTYPALW